MDKAEENRDNAIQRDAKENVAMTKTMRINGMMCGHCEARVKKCLIMFYSFVQAVISWIAHPRRFFLRS